MNYFLDTRIAFPHPEAVKSSGILAIAGDLSVSRLLLAYHYGIFPWYNSNEPILWWCPKQRYVIIPDKVKVAKSMNAYFNQQKYRVSYNSCFADIVNHCRNVPRHGQDGTWINDDILESYTALYDLGYAISAEVWDGDELVGGLYGVCLGKVFFGESMFSLKSNASKFGFISLARKLAASGFYLIDCQIQNSYLDSLGGEFMPGHDFQAVLKKNRIEWLQNDFGSWPSDETDDVR
ncbi:MAG: leucyl/phenylalanyl-tRNA--protein transferase [Saprospiraceae bacterium]|nr:leucyl/phenylalanyl-tRNA--protein transferase [Saprospiraceae bacterium]